MLRKCLFLFLFCFPFIVFAQNSQVEDYINTLKKDTDMASASWSIKVEKIHSNEVVTSYNSQLSLIPASIQKLVTTGVACHVLGENFRFRTLLMYTGNITDGVLDGNIFIIGGGDPFLGSYRYKQTQPDSVFSKWYTAIAAKGIKSIHGNIYYDAQIFDSELVPRSWIWEDMGNYYGSGASGLSFHENMYHLTFRPAAQKGGLATVLYTKPAIKSIYFENSVTTEASGTGDQVTILGAPLSNVRYLTGSIPLGKSDFSVRGSIPNPSEACADLFSKYLQQKSISISGKVLDASSISNTSIETKQTLLEYNSHNYSEIMRQTNLQSNNMYAECIFKYLGYAKSGEGSYETARKAVFDFLKEKSISTKGIEIVDGSGLSRQDLTTADFICSFLKMMYLSNSKNVFYNSLSKPERSATLSKFVEDNNSFKSLRFKTGSMNKVRSYAGYMQNANNEWVCFTIIMNNFTLSQTEIRNKMDQLLLYISQTK